MDESNGRWRCFADRRDGAGPVEVERAQLPALLEAKHLVWVDLVAPTSEDGQALGELFGFHPLAISDLYNNHVRPKQESYGEVLFCVFRALNFNPGHDALDTINVNLFLNHNFVVSVHCLPVRTVNGLLERVRTDKTIFDGGTSHFFYMILDGIVDRCLDILDVFEEEIDELEERVFQKNDPTVQQDIFVLKKRISAMRRLIAPEREALSSLIMGGSPQITTETRIHLRDVLDHVLRAQDMLESYRDLLIGLMDSYLTKISNHMNEVMKMLSIIATIMLPLGFLTGVFGMNFEIMPLLDSPYGFWGLVAAMLTLMTFMLFVFKKKKFL